jgi:exodeoxyribonuclease V alpha subunit
MFRDDRSLFTAMKVEPLEGGPAITAVGDFMSVAPEDRFVFTGDWVRHPKWGLQLRVSVSQRIEPHSPDAIVAFLSGGLFPGVGRELARRLVAEFGSKTLEVLRESPEALLKVPGLGPKRRKRVLTALREHQALQELALFLQGHGVGLSLVKKLNGRYGAEALAIVRGDPYRAADEVPGIGFLRADEIARKTGLPADSPARIAAAVGYVLKERCETGGHSFLPEPELVQIALDYLERGGAGVDPERVRTAVGGLVSSGRLVCEKPNAVFLAWVLKAEQEVARRLIELVSNPPSARGGSVAFDLPAERAGTLRYSPEQEEAIRQALTSPVSIVTGGPGTGKSTIIRAVVAAFESVLQKTDILLAAPTGRAANRLAEVTGREAQTIHRLLEFSPQGAVFQRDETNPLEGDLLVVDEASMVDLPLAHALVRAVPEGMRLLFVGDADQLPSVGLGNVFADLIGSGRLPVVRLRTIFRQARESRIVVNAHRVNEGQMPLLDPVPDFTFESIEDPAAVAAFIRQQTVACRRAGMGLHEINVLTPMRKGEAGVEALNKELQAALNPPGPGKAEIQLGTTVFRLGDKVMQTRNNYEAGVFNGDTGVIAEIRLAGEAESDDGEDEEDTVVVAFPSGDVAYSRDALEHLVLAYASTIHKAQGAEYSGTVFIPVVLQHSIMLQRNLIYTAITRARERVVLVGQVAAIRRAVSNVSGRRRYSRLAERLRSIGQARPEEGRGRREIS